MNTLAIAVVGGDLRAIRLAEKLSRYFKVYVYGMENEKTPLNTIECTELRDLHECEYVIGPIPLSKDGYSVHAPLSQKKILLRELCEVCMGKTLVAGVIKEEMKNLLEKYDVKYVDLMKKEEIAIANAIPTAEGAILYAMQNSEITLHGSRCLILGFGRCAKVLADKLKGIGAKVMICARKIEDLTYAKAYGYEAFSVLELDAKLNTCDFLFNTVPQILLDDTKVRSMNENIIYIELASSPGGINKTSCKKMNIKYVEAPNLPGKIAPTTAAEIIYEALLLVFQKEDKVNE